MSDFFRNPVVRSFVTTLLVTFVSAIPVAALSELDFSWLPAAGVAAAVAAVRTLFAALDPGNGSFGIGNTRGLDIADPLTDEGDLS